MNKTTFFRNSNRFDGNASPVNASRRPLVLLLGMDAETLLLMQTVLEFWNFAVAEADFSDALAAAKDAAPAVILIDAPIIFADGLTMMERLRNNDDAKDVPVVLLSGHAQIEIRQNALAHGAADFFVKPINFDALEKSLQYLTDKNNRENNMTDNTNNLTLENLSGFYELDTRGMILYEQSKRAGKAKPPVDLHVGDNFFEIVKNCSGGDKIRRRFNEFIGGKRTTDSFILEQADGDGVSPLRISMVRVLENGETPHGKIIYVDINQHSSRS